MKHISSSKLVTVPFETTLESVKLSVVDRLKAAYQVDTVGEGADQFTVTVSGRGSSSDCVLHVSLKLDNNKARVLMDGYSKISTIAKVYYAFVVFALLVIGLLPGTLVKTDGGGTAVDAMVFLFLGMFVVYDMDRKLIEAQQILDRVVNGVEADIGV